MALVETWLRQNLKEPVKAHYMNGVVFTQDNMANLIGVEVFDENVPASLSGTLSANVIRADHTTVAVDNGVIDGNRCYVTLPQAAYAVPGAISIILKLVSGSTVTTLGLVISNVYQSVTSVIIDPGTVIPSINSLIADIAEAVESIPMDWSEFNAEFDELTAMTTSDQSQIGMINLADGYDEYTYRGLTVKRYNGKLILNGTLTGNARIKISGAMDAAVAEKEGWKNDRLPVVAGHKYITVFTVLGGAYTPPSTAQDKYIIIRDNTGASTRAITYYKASENVLNYGSTFSSVWIEATSTNHAYAVLVCHSGETFSNLELSVRLIDGTYLEQYEDFRHQLLRADRERPTGFNDVLEASDEMTYRGISFSKNTNSANEGLLILDGTATGDIRAKVSKEMAAVPVTIPDAWAAERLAVVSGHIYCLYAYCVKGSYANENGRKMQFTLCGSSKESVTWCAESYQAGDMIAGKTFLADGNNAAYIQATIFSGSVFDDCRIRIGLVDLTVGNAYINLFNEGDMVERKVNSVLPFTDLWHYPEITIVSGIYTDANGEDTTYYLATVPLEDSNGNIIPIRAEWDNTQSPMVHAQQEKTSLTANAGMTVSDANGAVIRDGVVVHEADYTTIRDYLVYVGFDENRQAHEYSVQTSAQAMISAGIKNACIAYYRLVESGTAKDVSDIGLPASNLKKNPRMAMFTKSDGAVCFIACDGRKPDESGLTPEELASLMISLGAVDGWNLDGGGSTSLSINGVKQNKHIDGGGTVDRMINVTWNVPGIRPDYLLPECEQSASGTYQLQCTIANGRKTYSWVSI